MMGWGFSLMKEACDLKFTVIIKAFTRYRKRFLVENSQFLKLAKIAIE